jgi:hypothetical protein
LELVSLLFCHLVFLVGSLAHLHSVLGVSAL